jgi:hypothetical protein
MKSQNIHIIIIFLLILDLLKFTHQQSCATTYSPSNLTFFQIHKNLGVFGIISKTFSSKTLFGLYGY